MLYRWPHSISAEVVHEWRCNSAFAIGNQFYAFDLGVGIKPLAGDTGWSLQRFASVKDRAVPGCLLDGLGHFGWKIHFPFGGGS